jgi:Mn2+/Fe2+ NRAMP family transporter
VLGFGLFAAGFSSAVTAPLAAALAGRELLGRHDMGNTATGFRMIWGGVLGVGLLVACFEWDIIGVILAAQVANGLLLPFVAAIVLVMANDRTLLDDQVNANWQNVAGLLVAGFLAYKNFGLLLGKVLLTQSETVAVILAVVYLVGVGCLMWRRW